MSALKICPQCGTEYELDQRFCPKDGSTLRSQSQGTDLVGETIAQYYVLKKLGEGGMGQVYLAEHVKMGRKSALKVMNPSMVHDADAVQRFNREAKNASRINHTNVAAIYDFGETPDGMVFLAMEFVEGEPLTKLIERQGPLPPKRVADIIQQTAEALTVAHDMGIVHRDLKPDNIMLTKNRDGTDCVKVVDFGIAKAGDNEAQKVTKTGLVVGTPEYMSPEQLSGDKLDGRSDIYSLALVAFNCFTGKLPFPSETVQEAMIMRLTDRPRTLAEMRPEITWPSQLEAVMVQALARDANQRYQKASEFGRDLVRSVSQMASTIVAEAGTQVLNIPATRVSMSAQGGPSGPTLQTPAAVPGTGAPAGGGRTVAQAAPAGAVTATPPVGTGYIPEPAPPAKSKAPLAIGGVVGALALAGVVFVMTQKDDGTRTDAGAGAPGGTPTTQAPVPAPVDSYKNTSNVTPATDTAPTGRQATGKTGGAVRQPDTKAPTGTKDPVRTTPPAPTPATTAAAVDHSADLKRLEDLVDAKNPVDTRLRQALQLYARIQADLSGADLVRAKYHRGSAYMLLDDPERGCAVFDDIRGAPARSAGLYEAVEAVYKPLAAGQDPACK